MITTSEMPITDTYYDIEKLIHKICNDFQKKFGGEIEDLIGEAHQTFMKAYPKYDQNRGAFTTLLHHSIFRQLQTFSIRKKKREEKRAKTFTNQIWKFPAIPRFDWKTFGESLSDDAEMIVKLIFDSPKEINQSILNSGSTKLNWTKTLKNHLYDLGWSYTRISKSFGEIRGAL